MTDSSESQARPRDEAAAPAPRARGWRPDPAAVAIVALGLGLRVAFSLTGRTVLDGDEGVMGIMGARMASLGEFPLYFYNQRHLGTLEVPLLALVQSFGPEGWIYSAWAVRLTGLIFFALLAGVHYRLCLRFFGRPAARWILFFLCVAPVYWMDYSARLRHAALMMALGEGIALLVLTLQDAWASGRRLPGGRLFALGLLTGLAWWHYQLVAVFLVAAIPLALSRPGFLCADLRGDAAARNPARPAAALAVVAILFAAAACLAALPLGVADKYWRSIPAIVALALAAFGAAAVAGLRLTRRPVTAAPLALGGFLCGFAPAILFLATPNRGDWPSLFQLRFDTIGVRLAGLFFSELAWALDFSLYDIGGRIARDFDLRVTANLLLLPLMLVAVAERAIRPTRAGERAGALYFLTFAAALIALHIVTPRPTEWRDPRFLVPIFAATSVFLGLLADGVMRLIGKLPPRARRRGSAGAAAMVFAGAFWLWGPRWIERPHQPVDPRSGHRREVMEIVDALRSRAIARVRTRDTIGWVMIASELEFAARMKVSFNRGTGADRMPEGFPGPAANGPDYFILQGEPPADSDPETLRLAFEAGPFWFTPLDAPPPADDPVSIGLPPQ